MSPGYRLSSIAEADVASILEYIAADNLDAALRLVERFTETFERLASQPKLGEVYGHTSRNLRCMSVGNYLIFYQTLADEVLVARVLHGARQWENLI